MSFCILLAPTQPCSTGPLRFPQYPAKFGSVGGLPAEKPRSRPMPQSSLPPSSAPPPRSGGGIYIAAVVVLLLGIGLLIFWQLKGGGVTPAPLGPLSTPPRPR